MDIEFRNVGGSRVGFIIGSDVKDSGGNRVGMIVGDDIKDSSGNRVGIIIGNDIKDVSGNRVGMLVGDDIKDTYGNRIGYAIGSASELEKAAAAILLFGLKYEASANSTTRSSSSRGEITGWTILAGFFLLFWYYIKGPFVAFSLIRETAARKEWWGTVVRSTLLSVLFTLIIVIAAGGEIGGIIALVFLVAFLILPIVAVSIRRMHDIGKRGWWILIPLVSFVMCAFFRGKVEGNKYK
jgi:hypothetical protein